MLSFFIGHRSPFNVFYFVKTSRPGTPPGQFKPNIQSGAFLYVFLPLTNLVSLLASLFSYWPNSVEMTGFEP